MYGSTLATLQQLMIRGVRLPSEARGKLFEFMTAVRDFFPDATPLEFRSICIDSVYYAIDEGWEHEYQAIKRKEEAMVEVLALECQGYSIEKMVDMVFERRYTKAELKDVLLSFHKKLQQQVREQIDKIMKDANHEAQMIIGQATELKQTIIGSLEHFSNSIIAQLAGSKQKIIETASIKTDKLIGYLKEQIKKKAEAVSKYHQDFNRLKEELQVLKDKIRRNQQMNSPSYRRQRRYEDLRFRPGPN